MSGQTITNGTDTITPGIVLGFEAERESQNRVHPILGKESPDITYGPALLPSGRVTLGFDDPDTCEAESAAAVALLAAGERLTYTDPDRPTLTTTFAVIGRVGRPIEDATRNAFMVTFEYQAVTP